MRAARRRRPPSDVAALRGLGVLAAVARRDQRRGQDRADDREAGADEERDLEALGQGVRERGGVAARGPHQVVGACEFAIDGEDREAERAADLLRRVDQPGREARLLRGRRRSPRRSSSARTRSRGRPPPAATGTGRRRRTSPPTETCANQTSPTAVSTRPVISTGLKPTLVTRAGRDAGRDDDADRQRQVREPGLERVVAEHLLHVQRDEEEHREQRHRDQQRDDVRPGDRPQAEDRERHERGLRAQLDDDEHGRAARARAAARPSVWPEVQPASLASTSA